MTPMEETWGKRSNSMDLYEQHKSILEMAVRRQGFHYRMPEGGQEAMDSGLVGESDPTWMYSDDHRASNGLGLRANFTRTPVRPPKTPQKA